MINCAHPEHFSGVIDDSPWTKRIYGLRCNAARLSHAELDECEVLDDGSPVELAGPFFGQDLLPYSKRQVTGKELCSPT
jgi:S-methylmethionine-dependent homocysteine/selenocysteine methylase